MVVKVAVGFSGPVVARGVGKFMSEMVAKWEVVGKVVGQFTLMVAEKYQVALKVAVEFSGPVVARVIVKCIQEMVVKWEVVGKVSIYFSSG